jgi:hypothetical protein
MRREDLERFLENGNHLGFRKQTDSDEYLGWVILRKDKPNERLLSLLTSGEEPEFVAEQNLTRSKPYRVVVSELRRDVYESGRYEANEDYRLNEKHLFSNLDEVEEFVQRYGHTLENIKWRIEIEAS